MIRFAFTVCLLATTALAAEKKPTLNLPAAPVAEACQIDVKTHCGDSAKTAVHKCLHDHGKDLSQPCQAHINQRETSAKTDLKSASPVEKAGNLFQIPGQN